jgi:hypothetical protein
MGLSLSPTNVNHLPKTLEEPNSDDCCPVVLSKLGLMDKKIGFIDKKINDVGDKLNKLIEADPKVDSSGVVDSWWLAWAPAG